ncbi:hypothetical protein HK097_003959, partial [Rhizophlyctis rosea]
MPSKGSRKTLYYNAVWSHRSGNRTDFVSQRFKRSGAYVSAKNDNPEGLVRVAEKLVKGYVIGSEKRPGRYRNVHEYKLHDIEVLPDFHAQSSKVEKVCCVTFQIRYPYTVKAQDGVEKPGWKTGSIQIGPEYLYLDPAKGQEYVQQRAQQWVNDVMAGTTALRVDYEAELQPVDEEGDATWTVHDVHVVSIDPKNMKPPKQMKMKKMAPVACYYKTVDSETNQPEMKIMENVCVPTCLLEKIQQRARLVKKYNARGEPVYRGWPTSETGEKCPNSVLGITQWMRMKDPGEGVSVDMMHYFCKTFRISYYAFDAFSQCISKWPEQDPGGTVARSKNGEVLLFWVKDSHIYPITDPSLRHSLRQKAVEGREECAVTGVSFDKDPCEEEKGKEKAKGKGKGGKGKGEAPSAYFNISLEQLSELVDRKEKATVYYDAVHTTLEAEFVFLRDKTKVLPLVDIDSKRVKIVRTDLLTLKLTADPVRARSVGSSLG